jgi:ABC-type transport system substrate-binding protein
MNTRPPLFRRLASLCLASLCLALTLPAPAQSPAAAAPQKVLRLAFNAPETGFDSAQVSDLYSNIAISHIFEALYTYDHLARPFKIKPSLATGMPEVSADFRTWTVRLKPGTYFDNDPAFGGRKRELVAADVAFSVKRYFDPALKSPSYTGMLEEGLVGLQGLREAAEKTKKPFDYDREVDGVRALDRYTVQFRLQGPRPRFLYTLADLPVMAREVVEKYGAAVMEHPVGSGPYRLAQWRRSSLMVFERNPNYREVFYDAEPNADDAEGQAILAKLKGRRLPMIDRVEVAIIEESQPRWLSFLNAEFDMVDRLPLEFVTVATPQGKLAPNLEKQGIRMYRGLGSDVTFSYFNMDDPVVGGYTPDKVALRRAISLAIDVDREIRVVRRGQAIPAQSGVSPDTYGYDPLFKSENGDHDLGRAKALLDVFGYVDKNGDGWRDLPDGQPLVLVHATQPDQTSRQFDELWKRNMDALGIRLDIRAGTWPEQLKQARAGKLMMWQLGSSSTSPDGQGGLTYGYGPAAGGGNLSRFKLAAFDEVYRRIDTLPDGPERLAAFAEAKKILVAYMPYKYNVHRYYTDLTHPWVYGYRRPTFWRGQWHLLDVLPRR